MRKRTKIIIAVIVVLVVWLAAAVVILYDPDNTVLGNNVNACGYGRGGIHEKEFIVLEEALKAVMKDEVHEKNYDDMTMLYAAQTDRLEKVFMLYENEVCGYEFVVNENGSYSYRGVRSTVFADFFEKKEYDWKTTVLDDLSNSTQKGYKRFVNPNKNYGVLPAWGVSDTDKVKHMTVDGQKVDKVIEFSYKEETLLSVDY